MTNGDVAAAGSEEVACPSCPPFPSPAARLSLIPCRLTPGCPLAAACRRAVGDYATQQGKAEEGPAAVNGFFKALEAYDYQLLQVPLLTGTAAVVPGTAAMSSALGAEVGRA